MKGKKLICRKQRLKTKKETEETKEQAFYVKMNGYNFGIAKHYTFRIDPVRRKVDGYVEVRTKRPVGVLIHNTYEDPITGDHVKRFSAGLKMVDTRDCDDRAHTRVHCSKQDQWDPVIGVAVCKLKLDMMFSETAGGESMAWSKFKKIMQG